MADKIITRIEFEIQQIDHLLESYGHLREKAQRKTPDLVETTALASVLHSFYTGVEKIFTYVAEGIDGQSPSGARWHQELMDRMGAASSNRGVVLSEATIEQLDPYLDFRHFYRHGYSYVLEWEKLEVLVTPLAEVWDHVKQEVQRFLESLVEANNHDDSAVQSE